MVNSKQCREVNRDQKCGKSKGVILKYEIWHDNDFDLAHWFYLNSDLRDEQVSLRQIPKTNNVKDLLNHLTSDSDLALLPGIKYETPDLILIRHNDDGSSNIELVVEFMTHTPQHDHPLQRFTRIYGSAWLGIPSVLVIPNKKEKLEKGLRDDYRPTMYKANPLIYHLFIKTQEITKTPTILLMWPEVDGYLKYDKKHPTAPRVENELLLLFSLVNAIIKNNDISNLVKDHVDLQKKSSGYDDAGNQYDLTSGKVVITETVLKDLGNKISPKKSSELRELKESFLYSPQGLKSGSSAFRTDPYAGKVCAFDILFCRNSEGTRNRNMVLVANKILSKVNGKPSLLDEFHDLDSCPFLKNSDLISAQKHFKEFCPYTERKQQRIYGEIPDLIIYEDGEVYVPRN
jgi:hypothetical protein